jgi:ArsR family transcriptional regulator
MPEPAGEAERGPVVCEQLDQPETPRLLFEYRRNMEEMMKATQAVAALSALAHDHRLAIYRLLVETGPEGLSAGRIATRLKIPPSSLTFHVQHLHRSGLLTQERNSRQIIYAADFSAMNALVGYLTENCCGSSSAACESACEPAAQTRRVTRKASRAA